MFKFFVLFYEILLWLTECVWQTETQNVYIFGMETLFVTRRKFYNQHVKWYKTNKKAWESKWLKDEHVHRGALLLKRRFGYYTVGIHYQFLILLLFTQVVSGAVTAKTDRLEGIIDFSQVQDPLENLNDWSSNTNKLMDLVMKTTHLINKEEMVSCSL